MAKLTDAAITAVTTKADADLVYLVDVSDTTDDPAGSSKKITHLDARAQTLTEVADKPLLAAVTVDTSTVTDAPLAAIAKVGQWICCEAYTVQAELRRITGISGAVITVSRPFRRAHAIDDKVILIETGERNVRLFGALGDDSADETPAIQAAVDDFDIQFDTDNVVNTATFTAATSDIVTSTAHGLAERSPVFLTTTGTLPAGLALSTIYYLRDGTVNTFTLSLEQQGTAVDITDTGSGTHTWNQQQVPANNLFFPAGEYVFGSEVTLANNTTFNTGQTVIRGSNATLKVKVFRGPLFGVATVAEETGTHDGSSGAAILTDSTQSWSVDEHVGLLVRNTTDGSTAVITSNTSTTATGTLTGGTENDWDASDVYRIEVHRIGNGKYVFRDLTIRDEISTWPTNGLAHFVTNQFTRLRIENCTFSNWLSVIQSPDTTLHATQYLQSARVVGNTFNSCSNIITVAKAFDLLFADNLTDSCGNAVHCLGTAGAAFINGTIRNNTFQGSGATATTIKILGARALSIIGNYFESNGGIGQPEINMASGQQPRGLLIMGNRFSPKTAQLDDPEWYPIELSLAAEGVLIAGNQSEGGQLLDAATLNDCNDVRLQGNHLLMTEPSSWEEVIDQGGRTITRTGQLTTTALGPGNMVFRIGAPAYSVGHCKKGSVFSVEARVVAVKDSTRDITAKYAIAALFRDSVALDGTGFAKIGSTQVLHPDIEDAGVSGWGVDLITTDNAATFTVVFATDIFTSASHGLSDGDVIYFTTNGGTLPSPLIPNVLYFIRDSDANDFKVARGRGLTAVNITADGSGSRYWNQQDIELEITGQASTTIDWWATVTVQIGQDV